MENRRARNRPIREVTKKSEVTKKNTLRSSPSRKASPSSSTGRKSPARKASPGRKASPARRASPVQRPPSNASRRSSRTRSTVITPTLVVPPSPIKENKEPPPTPSPKSKIEKPKAAIETKTINDTGNKLPILTTITTESSVHSSYSISTQKTTDIGSANINNSGDSELAKLTDFIRRSVSKTFSTSLRNGSQTPSTHRSLRISRSISQSNYDDGDNYSKMEFSDSEEENFRSINVTKSTYTPLIERTSSSFCRKIEVPKEFGGLLGASLLLIIVPILSYYLPWCCRKKACEFKQPNLSSLMDWKYIEKIFTGEAVGSYLAFNSGVFVLSAALFGRFVRLPSDRPGCGYYFNGLPIAVIATLAFGIGEYMKYPIADFITRNYLRFALFSLVNAVLLALWCCFRANYIATPDIIMNPYAKTGKFIVDFCLGKQVNPKWFKSVDIKQVHYKICWISTLLLAEIYISKNIQMPTMPGELLNETETLASSLPRIAKFYVENINFDLTSLVASLMLLVYALDNLLFEHHMASSFELQQEGLGALVLLRYAATPFLLNLIPKYLFEHKPVALPIWAMISMAILFSSGLVLKRLSNKTKYQYRLNPNLPIFDYVESIHTFQGRRLLLGKLWGCVRQPNYAGEILMLLSFLVPICFKFTWPPLVCILLFIVFLVHRAIRVSARNSTRYHSSWVRYCMSVRNLVVPKIF